MRNIIFSVVLVICLMSSLQAFGQPYVANVAVSDGKICSHFPGGAVATVGSRLYFGTSEVHLTDDKGVVRNISKFGIELLKVGQTEVLLKTEYDKIGALFKIIVVD